MEYILGGTAAATAGGICNPLEVVKIRMQLQGELLAKGKYTVHYKNAFHAAYTIGSKEGLTALQKGLIPFMCYQFCFNGIRLGLYQVCTDKGFTKKKDGSFSAPRTAFVAINCGILGGFMCSPFYLVKTHLQSKANVASIAVGHQHEHTGLFQAVTSIVKSHGFFGLWRGASGNVVRLAVASGAQIPSFEISLSYFKKKFPESTWTPLALASFIAGFFISFSMAPFDLVATRFFNQGTCAAGKGLVYTSIFDCAIKVFKKEGALAFFKGWTACYFRLGPYTVICLSLWDRLKFHYHKKPKLEIQSIKEQLIINNLHKNEVK